MTVDALLEAIRRLKASCEMLGLKHPPMLTLATAEDGMAIAAALRARFPIVSISAVIPDTKPMRTFSIDGVMVQFPAPNADLGMADHNDIRKAFEWELTKSSVHDDMVRRGWNLL